MVRRVLLRLFPTSSTATILRLCLIGGLCLGVVSALPAGASAAAYAPVAAYSFDEGTGTIVEDLAGENDGTVEGATWTGKGRYGGAMEFGGEECVSIPNSASLQLSEEFTVEAWVRPDGLPTDDPILFKETEGVYSYAMDVGFGNEGNPAGFLDGEELAGPDLVEPDTWTHIAFSYDGQTTRLFVDGELVASEDIGSLPIQSEGPLYVGCDGPIWGDHFRGRIDELRVYDRALGAAEVAADMETPIQTPKSGPVADWSFDEDDEATQADNSGNGHTATVEGARWTARGRYGGAMEFDGVEGDLLSVPESPELDLAEEFTLEAWVRPGDDDRHWAPVIDKQMPGHEGLLDYAYYLYAGDWEEGRPGGGIFEADHAHAESPLPAHAWSHLALTWDGHTERLYVDGELVGWGFGAPPPTGEGDLEIGGGTEQGADLDGRIDEVRVYDRALNAGEVATDMEAPIQTPERGPVADYSFDEVQTEGEGTTVEDLTGDGHTATIHGAIWTEHGRYGGAMEFDAEGHDYLSVPASEELDNSEELTVEAWVRPSEDPAYYASIAMKEREGSGPGYSWTLDQHETEATGFLMQTEEGMVAGGQHSLPDDTWTHVAMTDDGAHDRLYVDGRVVDTEPAIPFDGHGPIMIGGNSLFGQWFDGRIDEVRIYDRALDAAEVGYDMEAPILTPRATPVAAYSFDEGEGSTLHDVTGDGHDGTIEGAEWAPGRYGKSLEFHSSGHDVVRIPDSPELDFSEEFTLEAWVRPDSAEEEMRPAIAKGAGEGESSQDPAYALYAAGAEHDHPMVTIRPAGGSKAYVQAGQALPGDAWSHVAMVYDGSEMHVYVDGVDVDDTPSGYPAITGGDLEIGGAGALGQYFDGRIDEVRIYNRSLDAAEVGADMEAPIQTPKQGPIAAWSFDEAEGTTVKDVTGDGHEGTIEGATWARGKYGDALQFDGEDDVVKVPDSPEFALTEGFTLESWVRPESASNEWAPILAKEIGGGKAAHELAWWLYEGGKEANVPFGGTEPTPGHRDVALGEDPLPVDAWSHLALTYDGAQVRLYVDGALVDCSPVPAGAPPVTEGEVQIGGATDHGAFFKGRIDEVRIYNRALNVRELRKSPADAVAKVVHATIYSGDPGSGGELIAQEWAQLDSDNSRREDAKGITTAKEVQCRTSLETRCVLLRSEVPPTGYTQVELSQSAPGSPSAGTLLLPKSEVAGREEAAGRLSETLASWQTPPPGHSTRVIKLEVSRSNDDNEWGEPEPQTSAWRFWVDAATRLPLKAELVLGEGGSTVSYYTYAPELQNSLALPAAFFFVSPPSEPPAGCEPSGQLGGWNFNPSGAVYPNPQFPAMLNGAAGPIALNPLGAASDGTEPRATLNGENGGIELTAGDVAEGALTWEIEESVGQSLEPSSSGYVLRSAQHVVTAEILLSGGATVEDGSPSGLLTNDLIALPNPDSMAIVRAPPGANWPTRPCYTPEELARADAVHLDSGGSSSEGSAGPHLDTTEESAPVVVFINPHPALKSVTVTDKYETCNGPHTKTAGEDGRVEFGGCPIGAKATFTVETPVTVASGTFAVADPSRTVTVPTGGWTVQYRYRRVSGEGPVEGEEFNSSEAALLGRSPSDFGPEFACKREVQPPYKAGDTSLNLWTVQSEIFIRCRKDALVDSWLFGAKLESKNVLFNASGGYRMRDSGLFADSPEPEITGEYTVQQGPETLFVRCEPGEAKWRTTLGPLFVYSEIPGGSGVVPGVGPSVYYARKKKGQLSCAG